MWLWAKACNLKTCAAPALLTRWTLWFDSLSFCHLLCLIHACVMCETSADLMNSLDSKKELQKVRVFLVFKRYKWTRDLWHIRLVFVKVWTVLRRWRRQSVQSFSVCVRRIIAPSSGYFVCPLGHCVEFLHANSAFFAVAARVFSSSFTFTF